MCHWLNSRFQGMSSNSTFPNGARIYTHFMLMKISVSTFKDNGNGKVHKCRINKYKLKCAYLNCSSKQVLLKGTDIRCPLNLSTVFSKLQINFCKPGYCRCKNYAKSRLFPTFQLMWVIFRSEKVKWRKEDLDRALIPDSSRIYSSQVW